MTFVITGAQGQGGPLDTTYEQIRNHRDNFGQVMHIFGDSIARGKALDHFPDEYSDAARQAEPLWELRSPASVINLLLEEAGQITARAADGAVTRAKVVAGYGGDLGLPSPINVEKAANQIRAMAGTVIRPGDIIVIEDAGVHAANPDIYKQLMLMLRSAATKEKDVTVAFMDMFAYRTEPMFGTMSTDFYRYDVPFMGTLTGKMRTHNEATIDAATLDLGRPNNTILIHMKAAMDAYKDRLTADYGLPMMLSDGIHPNVWGQFEFVHAILSALHLPYRPSPGGRIAQIVTDNWQRLLYGTRKITSAKGLLPALQASFSDEAGSRSAQ